MLLHPLLQQVWLQAGEQLSQNASVPGEITQPEMYVRFPRTYQAWLLIA